MSTVLHLWSAIASSYLRNGRSQTRATSDLPHYEHGKHRMTEQLGARIAQSTWTLSPTIDRTYGTALAMVSYFDTSTDSPPRSQDSEFVASTPPSLRTLATTPASSLPSRLSSNPSTRLPSKNRIPHACNRCRLLRTRCSGVTPCDKCAKDDAVCVFGDRKREKDKKFLHISLLDGERFTEPT